MRPVAKIVSGLIVAVLVFFLAACGGAKSSAGSSGAANGGTTQTAKALPGKPVCEVFPKEAVAQIIGQTIQKMDDINIFNDSHEPTICNYYLKGDADSFQIQWMLTKDALWDDQIAALGDNGAGTMRTRVANLGDDAIKETGTDPGETAVVYMVLLKKRGLVLSISNSTSLSNAALLQLTRKVIEVTQKL